MTIKEIIKCTITGLLLSMLLIATLFGAIYQQSLREKPLTAEEVEQS